MIDLYFWPTPNGHKILICLEELGVPYQIKPIDITAGDQHQKQFRAVSPFGLIPAIVHTTAGQSQPIFESGSILFYLAKTFNLLLPDDMYGTLAWLFWQVGGLGPMAGQSHHFNIYADTQVPYAQQRYRNETLRLYGILDKQLAESSSGFISTEYTIADIACYPWIARYPRQNLSSLSQFPNLERWFNRISNRPAVQKAYQLGKPYEKEITLTAETRKHLFTTGK